MRILMYRVWMLVIGIAIGGLVLIGSEAHGQNMIQVKGSDSEVNLVQRLAEVFMQKKPGVNIAVTGGGSGTGIAALINKQTDIANSSREMQPKEEEAAEKAGVHPFPDRYCHGCHIDYCPPIEPGFQIDAGTGWKNL